MRGSQWPMCHCRGALKVHPDASSAPQVPRAAHCAVLRSRGPPGAGVSPAPRRGTATPSRAAQPRGRTQLAPQAPLVPCLEWLLLPCGMQTWFITQAASSAAFPFLAPVFSASHVDSRVSMVPACAWALLSAFSSVTLGACDLLTVIPSHGDRCGLYLSKGQLHSSCGAAPVQRPHPSPESTTARQSPVSPPEGGSCHLSRHFFAGP